MFAGTSTDKDNKPTGMKLGAGAQWRACAQAVLKGHWFTPEYDLVYPDLTRARPDTNKMVRSMLAPATRITIAREKMDDILLPQSAVTEEVQRVFCSNYGDDEIFHGPAGRVNLTIGVPAGRSQSTGKAPGVVKAAMGTTGVSR